MPIPSPYYGSDYVVITGNGATFAVLADPIYTAGGYTAYTQYYKMAFGATGAYTPVTSSNPFPVTLSTGLTATISGFCGPIQIEGTPSGTPVIVSGDVVVSGLTSAPVYVQTAASCYVEVTGGRYINKVTDSISVYGPSGSTWTYTNLVTSGGTEIGTVSNPLYTQIVGATIQATVNATVGVTTGTGPGLRIQGYSGAYPVTVGVSGTVDIDDSAIVAGITALGVTLDAIYNALSVFGLVRPTSAFAGLTTTTTSPVQLGTGFTCAAGVNLKAFGSNTDLIYLGTSTVGSSYGYQLEPGENVFFNVSNINLIYAMAKSGNQILSYYAS